MRFVVVGGTGVVGVPVIDLARRLGNEVIAIGHKHPSVPDAIPPDKIDSLKGEQFDAVIDIWAYDAEYAKKVQDVFKDTSNFVVMSTTLVYDRRIIKDGEISEDAPIVHDESHGGYVKRKSDMESAWHSSGLTGAIARPYHIIGDSALGCFPRHNRDQDLVWKINNDKPVYLIEGGETNINTVFSYDLARSLISLASINHEEMTPFNIVNPDPHKARDYYEIVGELLGKEVRIEAVPKEVEWVKPRGWSLTALPHEYSVARLNKTTGYVPSTPVEEAIEFSLYSSLNVGQVHERMNELPAPIDLS